MLSNIPQLASLYDEADETLAGLERFVAAAEADLCICLRESTPPPADLVLAIATCKVRAVETSIDLTFRLKQEVGSFALMADAGFRHLDFLQCAKFAEGDSRILMQKMARDRLKQYGSTQDGFSSAELELCDKISQDMAAEITRSGDRQAAWNSSWRDIYALADAVMNNVQATYGSK